MNTPDFIAALLTLAALFSYINHRWLRLPTTIGLMILALMTSLLLIALGYVVPSIALWGRGVLEQIDFEQTLMNGMLAFLLFAGALHINLGDLAKQGSVIALLASIGVLISTAIIAVFVWFIGNYVVGIDLAFIYCLLFGALISPTDPIAVLGILKTVGAPKVLKTNIAGESLFNDGVGVVIFLVLAGIAGFGYGGHIDMTVGGIIRLFTVETGGGLLTGLILGFIAYHMLKSVDNYQVEILISLAVVAGGYAFCNHLHLSGPIAMVVAGLLIGNHGRTLAMSDSTREHLDTFWELVDELLNAVLFVLIGLEMLVLTFTGKFLLAGLVAIPATLLARFIVVGGLVQVFRRHRKMTPHTAKIITWSGLRGGISVALALSIPKTIHGEHIDERDAIIAITYVIVVFSIIVQGLTIAPLLRACGHGDKL